MSATPPTATPTNAKFTMRYNEVFSPKVTMATSPASPYDAYYLLAYAAVAAGDGPLDGPSLSRAIPRLLPPGDPLDVGSTGIFTAAAALRAGKNVDLAGAYGRLDFDVATDPNTDLILAQSPFSQQSINDLDRIEAVIRDSLTAEELHDTQLYMVGTTANVRDLAVVALRHWIGRGTEEDRHLHEVLIQEQKYPANQAEIVMQLLHGFDTNDLARPATYEVLIEYLMHDRPAIRQLAQWHLRRLVPAGGSIPYDPTAAAEDRHKAQERWKKLVPNGKVPENAKAP